MPTYLNWFFKTMKTTYQSRWGQNPGWSLWRALKEFIANLVWVDQNAPRSAQKTMKVNKYSTFSSFNLKSHHMPCIPYTLPYPYIYISTIYMWTFTHQIKIHMTCMVHCKVKHHQPPGVDPWSHCHRACAVVWWVCKQVILNEKHWKTHMYINGYMYPCMYVSVPMSLSMICALRYARMHG